MEYAIKGCNRGQKVLRQNSRQPPGRASMKSEDLAIILDVKKTGLRPSKRPPDFIGIGATRAGTSWLHHVLSGHPDIWASPVKELHYYDRPMNNERSFFCDKRRCRSRMIQYIIGRWNANHDGLFKSLNWDLKYFFKRRSESWYASLFAQAGNRIAGEVTPAYAILDKETIFRINANHPDLRAVYLLRNPINRGWSGIVNGLAKKKRISIKSVSDEKIISKIESPGFLARSNYADNIRRWRDVIGNDRLFIGFFEDIILQPRVLIDRLCDFLGVRDSSMISDKRILQPRNSSKPYSASMPQNIALYLTKRLHPMIKDAQQLLGGYTNNWLEKAENILAGKFPIEDQK
jgi:hypothetical protein